MHLVVVGLFNCRYQPGGLSAFFQLNLGLLTEEAVALPVTPKVILLRSFSLIFSRVVYVLNASFLKRSFLNTTLQESSSIITE